MTDEPFYDTPGVFEAYAEHRHAGPWSPNVVMEEPAMRARIGPPAGLRVLELGCGDGALAAALLAGGCASYLGLDASARMVAAARGAVAAADPGPGTGSVRAAVAHGTIERFAPPWRAFDLIVSSTTLHYVAELEPVLAGCHAALVPGGRLLLSVVHPVLTSHDGSHDPDAPRTSWLVDDYFVAGPRERDWLGARVTWHHRPVEAYVRGLLDAGFALTWLEECAPLPAAFGGDADELARRRRVPLFLLLEGTVAG